VKWLKWKRIYDLDQPDEVYLDRLFIIKTRWFGLYLHRIYRADYAKCEHNHPWAFITLILRGGYEEEVARFLRRPGYVGYRPRSFEHRITRLLKGPALTLVFRGPDHFDWGFVTKLGYMPWEEWVESTTGQRVLWCDDSAVSK
jgi:hypothetical protein